ncbi:MAG TPA: ABC transporter ATP-binding protein [Coriobacteriia bacterium]|nr:ABC transporter ATP-binding protein [Coriobacteriia bacterium]
MSLENIKAQALTTEMSHRATTRTVCEGPGCPTTVRQQYDAYVARLRQRSTGPEGSRPAKLTGASTSSPAAISVTSVTKRYRLGKDNHVNALRGATLEIDGGEMVAIVGPSGSGKSTVMHLIGCLDTPDAGDVYINGRRVNDLRGGALTRLRGTEIGFIFQGFNLVPTMSAIDNVALAAEYAGTPRSEARQRAEELLALVGLAERSAHLPSELSGGQQQRVAIARALVNRPSIVLGDEPTGDLDTATSDEIVALLRRINVETGTTFVIVTHNPEVAEACDRTIKMRDGLVEDHGHDRCCTTTAPRASLPRIAHTHSPALAGAASA